MNLKHFLKECSNKNVFKMISIYLVSTWILLQVLAVTGNAIGLPTITMTYVIVFLLLGFPIHLFLIWKIYIAPLKKEINEDEEEALKEYISFNKKYMTYLGFISFFCAVSVVFILNKEIKDDVKILSLDQSDKIVVLKFGNNTGDPDFDIVSKMTSDWILHGITKNKAGQVISDEMIEEYANVFKIKNNSGELNPVIQDYLLPSKIISGNFFLKNQKLLFQCVIKDGKTNEIIIAFKTIESNQDDPLKGIDELKELIVGFLMTESRKSEMLQEIPPKYNAYKYVLEAKSTDDKEMHIQLLNKAIQNDPDFFEPKVLRVAHYYNQGNYIKSDSLLKAIKPDSKSNKRQLNLLNTYRALLAGNNKKVYNLVMAEFNITTFDISSNKSAMVVALQFVNRPLEVDPIFKVIKMESMDIHNCNDCIIRMYVKALADIELNKYEEVQNLLEPIIETTEATYIKKPLIAAYVRSGNFQKIAVFLDKYKLLNKSEDFQDLCLFTAKEFLLMGNTLKANEYLDKVINAPTTTSELYLRAQAFYYKKNYPEAEILLKNILKNDSNNSDIIAKIAICNLEMNKIKQANNYLINIEKLRSTYQFGSIDYALAQFYAISKNKIKTEEHLLKAVAAGHLYTNQTFQNDPHFIKYKNATFFKNVLTFWH